METAIIGTPVVEIECIKRKKKKRNNRLRDLNQVYIYTGHHNFPKLASGERHSGLTYMRNLFYLN